MLLPLPPPSLSPRNIGAAPGSRKKQMDALGLFTVYGQLLFMLRRLLLQGVQLRWSCVVLTCVVQFYDSDRRFPAWGFGGKISAGNVSH
ncbi:hypothetical protein Fmac_017439 [Flemingia macrophylla]|uniref:Uncharacterized protein n=1 Tax=Flemingia macrophylla TaxID=520843 RepID=A0ABD1M266_9FABA